MCGCREDEPRQRALDLDNSKGFSSSYIGVSWHRASGRWHGQMRHNGKRISLGYFHTEVDAARAYDKVWVGLLFASHRDGFQCPFIKCRAKWCSPPTATHRLIAPYFPITWFCVHAAGPQAEPRRQDQLWSVRHPQQQQQEGGGSPWARQGWRLRPRPPRRTHPHRPGARSRGTRPDDAAAPCTNAQRLEASPARGCGGGCGGEGR